MDLNKPANYKAEVIRAATSSPIAPKPGAVSQVTVSHDSWCQINSGGRCNCEPTVKPGTPNRAQRRAQKRK